MSKLIAVLAGNYEQYMYFCREQGVGNLVEGAKGVWLAYNDTEYRYVSREQDALSTIWDSFVATGTFWGRADASTLYEAVRTNMRCLNQTPKTLEYSFVGWVVVGDDGGSLMLRSPKGRRVRVCTDMSDSNTATLLSEILTCPMVHKTNGYGEILIPPVLLNEIRNYFHSSRKNPE